MPTKNLIAIKIVGVGTGRTGKIENNQLNKIAKNENKSFVTKN